MMSQQHRELSFIIVNWNGGEALEACLDSVAAACQGVEAEVVLVDNASTDGSGERAAARPLAGQAHVKLIRNPENVGFARAANQALSEATGRMLVLLNPDAQIEEEALTGLREVMRRDGRIGIAGCGSEDASGRQVPAHELSFPGGRGSSD